MRKMNVKDYRDRYLYQVMIENYFLSMYHIEVVIQHATKYNYLYDGYE